MFEKNLPRICATMRGGEHYSYKDDTYLLTTTGSYRVGRMYLNKRYISFKLTKL
jgi:hypothetical protein